jgi:hypothetical protein
LVRREVIVAIRRGPIALVEDAAYRTTEVHLRGESGESRRSSSNTSGFRSPGMRRGKVCPHDCHVRCATLHSVGNLSIRGAHFPWPGSHCPSDARLDRKKSVRVKRLTPGALAICENRVATFIPAIRQTGCRFITEGESNANYLRSTHCIGFAYGRSLGRNITHRWDYCRTPTMRHKVTQLLGCDLRQDDV